MVFHLLSVPILGTYAVFSFFILSGFLMTMIMHESYGYTKDGVKRFTINRFLRLYPMYWVAASISIITIVVVTPNFSLMYHKALDLPDNFKEIFYNFSMLFFSISPLSVEPRLSPPTWALTVEIFYYVLIAFGLSRSKKITLVWLAGSLVYFVLTYYMGLSPSSRYNIIFAASLPFSLGAILYFYKDKLFALLSKNNISNPLYYLAAYILNSLLFSFFQKNILFIHSEIIVEMGMYLNMLLTLFVLTVLFHWKGNRYITTRIDKIFGDYSYPIYLLHWQCALLVSYILFESPEKGYSSEGITVFFGTLLLVFIISLVFIALIDKNVSRIRERIKKNNSKTIKL